MSWKSLSAALTLAIAALAIVGPSSASATIADRQDDPVVLTGADVPALAGAVAGDVVGFGFDGDWYQVPIQVDERKTIDPRTLYPFPSGGYVTDGTPFQIEVYADPETLTGEDPDPSLDGNDEISFMTYDTGVESDASDEPFGVVPGSGVKVRISDPEDGDSAWIYLFESDGSLEPSADSEYVSYDYSPDELDFDFADGPNLEDSTVSTPYYETHSSDRWVDDGLWITDGIEDPVNILDRDKVLFAPGVCDRSEDTFIEDEGSFIANINGPIRGIRSYVGANSGPYTQREHIYYEQREDIRTYVRVHQISGAMWFFDYSPEAVGMTYRNSLNPVGVTIDGVPDTSLTTGLPSDFATGGVTWEQVTGDQGTMDVINSVDTDIPGLRFDSYQLDDSTPGSGAEAQCTGDQFAYGSSGIRISSTIPNTDPNGPPAKSLTSLKSLYFSAPGGTAKSAEAHADRVEAPLTSKSSVLVPGPGGGDGGGAKLTLKVKAPARPVEPGRSAKVRVTIRNTGDEVASRLKICLKPGSKLSGGGCFTKADLGPGKTRLYRMKVRLKKTARPGSRNRLTVIARAEGAQPVKRKVKIRASIR